MTVAIEIPDDLERQLRASWSDLPRRVLEAVALEATAPSPDASTIGRLLGMASRWMLRFLRSAGASLHYDDTDLARDRGALDAATSVKVVSDTSPLSYLILVGRMQLLPDLLGAITIPGEVHTSCWISVLLLRFGSGPRICRLGRGPHHPGTRR